HQEIAVESADVDWSVGRIVNRINVCHCSRGMSESHNFFDVVNGSDGIRRVSDGNQLRPAGNLTREVLHIERAIRLVDFGKAHSHTTFFESLPRRYVCTVIKLCEQDFIARSKFPPNGAAHRKRQRSHIRTEYNFIRS